MRGGGRRRGAGVGRRGGARLVTRREHVRCQLWQQLGRPPIRRHDHAPRPHVACVGRDHHRRAALAAGEAARTRDVQRGARVAQQRRGDPRRVELRGLRVKLGRGERVGLQPRGTRGLVPDGGLAPVLVLLLRLRVVRVVVVAHIGLRIAALQSGRAAHRQVACHALALDELPQLGGRLPLEVRGGIAPQVAAVAPGGPAGAPSGVKHGALSAKERLEPVGGGAARHSGSYDDNISLLGRRACGLRQLILRQLLQPPRAGRVWDWADHDWKSGRARQRWWMRRKQPREHASVANTARLLQKNSHAKRRFARKKRTQR